MSTEAKKVVVILDASRELSISTIKWPLLGLSLKSGDKLLLLGILHQVNNPMGYKIKVDPNSTFRTNRKIVDEEMERKLEEYHKHAEIVKLSNLCKNEQIEFRIEMKAGSPLKVVALKAAQKHHATWLVLDRYMKSDQTYFLDNLPCNIVRLKKDNTIEELRGPNETRNNIKPPAPRRSNVTYGATIPLTSQEQSPRSQREYPWQNNRKSISDSASTATYTSNGASISSSNGSKLSSTQFHEEEHTTATGPETGGEHSPQRINESGEQKELISPDENKNQLKPNDDCMGGNPGNQVFKNSVCLVCKNKRSKVEWMRDFTYAELQAATDGFNVKNFLSEGGFGSVYRGEINGLKIAVKQHKHTTSFQGEKEFKSEVQVLRKVRHENLVMLVGCCSEGNHRLLVYEFVCNGSLDLHLSKHTRKPLSWEKRVKIAVAAARGLKYLHENNIIHRDVRPNNILVTHDFEPLLGNFGLARTQLEDSDQSSESVTRVVGTLGYLAPEYAECGIVSTKTDVYSFGVVLLQLISGMKTTDKRLGGKSLVGWARPRLKDRNYPDMIDPRIVESHDVHQLFWMVRVAEKCLVKDPQRRLSMDKVVYALNYIMDSQSIRGHRDLSPAQSSEIVSQVSSESQSQSQSQSPSHSPCEDDHSSFTIETASLSRLSQFGGRLPPSPSLSRK